MTVFEGGVGVSEEQQKEFEVWKKIAAYLASWAPSSERKYRQVMLEWCSHLGKTPLANGSAKALSDATKEDALEFAIDSANRNGQASRHSNSKVERCSKGTVVHKLFILRAIYSDVFGLDKAHSIFPKTLTAQYNCEHGTKRPTEFLEHKEVQQLLEAPDLSTRKGRAESALLHALFGGALRCSEALSLRVGDLQERADGSALTYLRDTKKHGNTAHVIPAWAAKVVLAFQEERVLEKAALGDYLFNSSYGDHDRTEPRTALRMIKSYAARAGISKPIGTHSGRKSAVVRLQDLGVAAEEIIAFTRHSNVSMLRTYGRGDAELATRAASKLEY